MESTLEIKGINEESFSFHFKWQEEKQKLLIHALLHCSPVSLEDIGGIIQVSRSLLEHVYKGYDYLRPEEALRLVQLFLIVFAD